MAKIILCFLLIACLGAKPGMSQTNATTTESTGTGSTPGATAGTTVAATSLPGSNSTTGATSNQTEPLMTSMATDNSSANATLVPTETVATSLPVTSAPVARRYSVNGTDGVCILMQFSLEIDIPFNNTDGKMVMTTFTFPDNTVPSGNCTGDRSRSFVLSIPDFEDWSLRFDFDTVDTGEDESAYEMSAVYFNWKYEAPFFDSPEMLNETDEAQTTDREMLNVRAETGMTFQCSKREIPVESAVVMNLQNLMYQPFADESAQKGDFGNVQLCAEDVPTNSPPGTTQASTDKTGMIVGIIIGVLAAVILILGGVYFLMRHKHKRESYKSLD